MYSVKQKLSDKALAQENSLIQFINVLVLLCQVAKAEEKQFNLSGHTGMAKVLFQIRPSSPVCSLLGSELGSGVATDSCAHGAARKPVLNPLIEGMTQKPFIPLSQARDQSAGRLRAFARGILWHTGGRGGSPKSRCEPAQAQMVQPEQTGQKLKYWPLPHHHRNKCL